MTAAPAFEGPPGWCVGQAFGVWQIAATQPEREAVLAADGLIWTFGFLAARANRLSHLLRTMGVEVGDAVAVLLHNEPDALAMALATSQIGAYLVPMNWHLTAHELAFLIGNSRAKVLLAGQESAEAAQVAADAAGLPDSQRLVAGGRVRPRYVDLDGAAASQPDTLPNDRCAGGLMFYSSGTTGRPKGVRKALFPGSPEAMQAKALPLYAGMFGLRPVTPDSVDTHLIVTPMYHAAPCTRALQMLHLGHRIVLMDKWQPEQMLAAIERLRVGSVQMVPIMFHRLLKLPDEVRARYRLDSLHTVIHAAAPCPVEAKRRMIDWWGPILHEYYAATEGGGTVVDSVQWLRRPGTVGRPYSFSTVRILDDQGVVLPAGEVGLVYMRDGFEFEYFDDPAKTAAAKRDGFFTAGDHGYFDVEGHLFLCDRRTDMILSGGVNIYPAEIESVLMAHPYVADAAAFGLADEEWGQRVQAVVQPQPGAPQADALFESLRAWCAEHLAGFKRPRDFALAKLPRNDAGKIGRGALRERFLAGTLEPTDGP